MAEPRDLGPTGESSRILALDATRGFALLGIFCVNIGLFGAAFGDAMRPEPKEGVGALDVAAFYFTKIFCEGKFYPLFSMMFAIGLILQRGRAEAAGRAFGPVYLRRLAALLVFGLAHAFLLWYGDILFVYSLAGAGLLLFSFMRARAMLITGLCVIAVAAAIVMGMGALGAMGYQAKQAAATTEAPAEPAAEAPPEEAPPEESVPPAAAAGSPLVDTPYERFLEALLSGQLAMGPSSELWISTETEAYQNGPYLQLFLFRATTWVVMIIYFMFSFFWHVLGMFFIGAALMKWGLYEPGRLHWHRRFILVGILVGLPLCTLAAFLPVMFGPTAYMLASAPIIMIAGPLLSLAYLGGMNLLARSAAARPAVVALASVGRVGLTNYLLQSVIATTTFYYYGFGMFGRWEHGARLLFVLGVYAGQVILSNIYLKYFQIGPVEWLWRTVTYLKPQPFRRAPATC